MQRMLWGPALTSPRLPRVRILTEKIVHLGDAPVSAAALRLARRVDVHDERREHA